MDSGGPPRLALPSEKVDVPLTILSVYRQSRRAPMHGPHAGLVSSHLRRRLLHSSHPLRERAAGIEEDNEEGGRRGVGDYGTRVLGQSVQERPK